MGSAASANRRRSRQQRLPEGQSAGNRTHTEYEVSLPSAGMGMAVSHVPGIGLSVTRVQGYAETAGVQPMDLVLKVNGQNAANM